MRKERRKERRKVVPSRASVEALDGFVIPDFSCNKTIIINQYKSTVHVHIPPTARRSQWWGTLRHGASSKPLAPGQKSTTLVQSSQGWTRTATAVFKCFQWQLEDNQHRCCNADLLNHHIHYLQSYNSSFIKQKRQHQDGYQPRFKAMELATFHQEVAARPSELPLFSFSLFV